MIPDLEKKILTILKNSSEDFLKRTDIENQIEYSVPKATLVDNIRNLIGVDRIGVFGQGRGTRYQFSNKYHENDKFKEKLYIYQNHILIGYLGFDYDKYYFTYDTEYILSNKYSVSFGMEINLNRYEQNNCFVDFEECLPEGIDREILIEKTGNATEFFLLKNNDYSGNDLIFSHSKLTFNKNIPVQSYLTSKNEILGKNKFPNILNLDKILLDDETLFPSKYIDDEEKIKQIRTMSLSGYQHKLQVIIEDQVMREPKDGESVSYFIKPYNPDKADENSEYYFPHIAINEHMHLTFAKNELRFDVPESGIFKSENDKEYHYIVKYFDRYKNYKFHRKEFSTYLRLDSSKKYKSSSEKLFEKAAKVLPRHDDRLRMIEYYFYSFVIRYEDMHTKNISTLLDNQKTFIAPLYDIACTGFYDGIKNYESHLTVNGKRTNIRYKDFIEIVKKANVSVKDFRSSAKVILDVYIKFMPKYIKKVASLENINFYRKSKPNAEGKKMKILSCSTLDEVMMKSFEDRIKTLKRNGWFE